MRKPTGRDDRLCVRSKPERGPQASRPRTYLPAAPMPVFVLVVDPIVQPVVLVSELVVLPGMLLVEAAVEAIMLPWIGKGAVPEMPCPVFALEVPVTRAVFVAEPAMS